MPRPSRAKPPSLFHRFNLSPEVIRLVMMYVRFPLSLGNVEDLLVERGVDISHEMIRQWWNRFGTMFAGDIRRGRVSRMRGYRQWRWHLNEMYVRPNGERVTAQLIRPHRIGVKRSSDDVRDARSIQTAIALKPSHE